jgi:arylformamidase
VDAPFHFFADGKTAESIPLDKTMGFCYVTAPLTGELTASHAKAILTKAKNINSEEAKRILLKGDAVVSEEAAQVFAEAGIALIGTETLSVGPVDAPMAVHKILLGAEVALLEGIRLTEVNEGSYFLSAAPLSLKGSDGSPCRAVLIEFS